MSDYIPLPAPTGSRKEIAAELLRRCEEREKRLLASALEATRDGDDENTWFAMAARAENNRFKARILKDLAADSGKELSNPNSLTK